jgi:hypothetical protein
MDFLPCRYSLQFLVDRDGRIFSYFLGCQSLFISRGVDGLRMARRSIWTRSKPCVGLERPTFAHGSVAKVIPGVAPAQQETSLGPRGENLIEAAEEGRNYLLQLRLQHLLQLGMRICPGKTRK